MTLHILQLNLVSMREPCQPGFQRPCIDPKARCQILPSSIRSIDFRLISKCRFVQVSLSCSRKCKWPWNLQLVLGFHLVLRRTLRQSENIEMWKSAFMYFVRNGTYLYFVAFLHKGLFDGLVQMASCVNDEKILDHLGQCSGNEHEIVSLKWIIFWKRSRFHEIFCNGWRNSSNVSVTCVIWRNILSWMAKFL